MTVNVIFIVIVSLLFCLLVLSTIYGASEHRDRKRYEIMHLALSKDFQNLEKEKALYRTALNYRPFSIEFETGGKGQIKWRGQIYDVKISEVNEQVGESCVLVRIRLEGIKKKDTSRTERQGKKLIERVYTKLQMEGDENH